jgi:hypothetical protein
MTTVIMEAAFVQLSPTDTFDTVIRVLSRPERRTMINMRTPPGAKDAFLDMMTKILQTRKGHMTTVDTICMINTRFAVVTPTGERVNDAGNGSTLWWKAATPTMLFASHHKRATQYMCEYERGELLGSSEVGTMDISALLAYAEA